MNGVDPRWNGKNSDGGNVNNNAAVTTKGYPGLGDRVAPPHPPPPQSFRQSSSPLMQQRREQASLSPTDDFGPGIFRSVSPGPQQGFDGRVNGNGYPQPNNTRPGGYEGAPVGEASGRGGTEPWSSALYYVKPNGQGQGGGGGGGSGRSGPSPESRMGNGGQWSGAGRITGPNSNFVAPSGNNSNNNNRSMSEDFGYMAPPPHAIHNTYNGHPQPPVSRLQQQQQQQHPQQAMQMHPGYNTLPSRPHPPMPNGRSFSYSNTPLPVQNPNMTRTPVAQAYLQQQQQQQAYPQRSMTPPSSLPGPFQHHQTHTQINPSQTSHGSQPSTESFRSTSPTFSISSKSSARTFSSNSDFGAKPVGAGAGGGGSGGGVGDVGKRPSVMMFPIKGAGVRQKINVIGAGGGGGGGSVGGNVGGGERRPSNLSGPPIDQRSLQPIITGLPASPRPSASSPTGSVLSTNRSRSPAPSTVSATSRADSERTFGRGDAGFERSRSVTPTPPTPNANANAVAGANARGPTIQPLPQQLPQPQVLQRQQQAGPRQRPATSDALTSTTNAGPTTNGTSNRNHPGLGLGPAPSGRFVASGSGSGSLGSARALDEAIGGGFDRLGNDRVATGRSGSRPGFVVVGGKRDSVASSSVDVLGRDGEKSERAVAAGKRGRSGSDGAQSLLDSMNSRDGNAGGYVSRSQTPSSQSATARIQAEERNGLPRAPHERLMAPGDVHSRRQARGVSSSSQASQGSITAQSLESHESDQSSHSAASSSSNSSSRSGPVLPSAPPVLSLDLPALGSLFDWSDGLGDSLSFGVGGGRGGGGADGGVGDSGSKTPSASTSISEISILSSNNATSSTTRTTNSVSSLRPNSSDLTPKVSAFSDKGFPAVASRMERERSATPSSSSSFSWISTPSPTPSPVPQKSDEIKRTAEASSSSAIRQGKKSSAVASLTLDLPTAEPSFWNDFSLDSLVGDQEASTPPDETPAITPKPVDPSVPITFSSDPVSVPLPDSASIEGDSGSTRDSPEPSENSHHGSSFTSTLQTLASKMAPTGLKRRRSQGSNLALGFGRGGSSGTRKHSNSSSSSLNSFGGSTSGSISSQQSMMNPERRKKGSLRPDAVPVERTSGGTMNKDKSLPPTPTSLNFADADAPPLPTPATSPPRAIGRTAQLKKRLSRLMIRSDLGHGGADDDVSPGYSDDSRSGTLAMNSSTSVDRVHGGDRGGSTSSSLTGHHQTAQTNNASQSKLSLNKGLRDDGPGSPRIDGCFPKTVGRRSSFSGLLNGVGDKVSKVMTRDTEMSSRASLDAARTLDRTATGSGNGDKGSRPPSMVSRKSLDMLFRRDAQRDSRLLTSRKSTDDVLSLASARLAELDLKGSSSTTQPNRTSRALSSPPSPSSPMDEGDSFEVGVAARISIDASSQLDAPDLADLTSMRPETPPASVTLSTPVLLSRDEAVQIQRRNSEATLLDFVGRDVGQPYFRRRQKLPDSGVRSDATLSSGWLEIEDAHFSYSVASKADDPDRAGIITGALGPFLKREEAESSRMLQANEALARRQREIMFIWLDTLMDEMKQGRPANRGASLDAIASIAESRFMSAAALDFDEVGKSRFRQVLVSLLVFAVSKLNEKAVFANTLMWAGRMLALASFRLEGVALDLLRRLPAIKKANLTRLMTEAGLDEKQLAPIRSDLFPEHMQELTFAGLDRYITKFSLPRSPEVTYLVQSDEGVVELTGNWLVRWGSSDSDLPFSFYRAYHRLLTLCYEGDRRPRPKELLRAPGYLWLCASMLEKADSLIHRNLRSVTTVGPTAFNAQDSAMLSVSAKPKAYDALNRRLVTTWLDIIGCLPTATAPSDPVIPPSPELLDRKAIFNPMLRMTIALIAKKTSLWDTRGVFLLLDFIEHLISTTCSPSLMPKPEDGDQPRVAVENIELFDVPFIYSFVKTILSKADNVMCLMRTISFIYAEFEVFCTRPQDRHVICTEIILDREIFNRLFLHYNANVRMYFLRLLVWRLSRLGTGADGRPLEQRDPAILSILQTLNTRLEVIRKRHDELEPFDLLATPEYDQFRPKRSTICSTHGVSDQPWTVDEFSSDVDVEVSAEPEAQQETGEPQRPSPGALETKVGSSSKDGGGSKMLSWLKLTFAPGKKTKQNRMALASSVIDPFPFGSPPKNITGERGDSTDEALADRSGSLDGEAADTFGSDTPDSDSPPSPSFFQFEFEIGTPQSDSFDPSPVANTPATTTGPPSPKPSLNAENDNKPGSSGKRRSQDPDVRTTPRRPPSAYSNPASPRVSLRFSKRVSILPPPALDLLTGADIPMPPLPEQYRPQAYDQRMHAYARRALFEYESALDEYDIWKLKIDEEDAEAGEAGDEEGMGSKSLSDLVPRLGVSWPQIFDD